MYCVVRFIIIINTIVSTMITIAMCEVCLYTAEMVGQACLTVQSSARRKQCHEVDYLDVVNRQEMAGGVQQQPSVSEAWCVRNGCGIDDVLDSGLAMLLVVLLVVLSV